MRTVFLAGLCMIGGCTLERIEHDSTQYLGMAGVSERYTVERSTRWRLDDPGRLEMDANFDPNDPGQVRLLRAAYDGVAQVYPLTLLRQEPTDVGTSRQPEDPVALLIHIDIPATGGHTKDFPVALVDIRTGAVIDRATLMVRSGWWGSADDAAAVSQLFCDYASSLRPKQ